CARDRHSAWSWVDGLDSW
nr:immunoglobulin heavy chain junction region [Macaca mulatta]MOW23867.1 immunoglobulin heavy chain junction region [Macaca mulatta]MOW24077.1 immunoglobulin heavy chain junction region [Macaca mulatta]MOW24140.1 immunoglobulin heavy chain junction region [Macaca mulatta]MOW24997.1 immunoglobulin heavy chain junction region [Macaca mulatta]